MDDLAIWVVALTTPIWFEQMDSSIMGGTRATHVTEPIKVEIGHWEHLCFIVVDRMIEPLILRFTWLDKWQPVI